MNQVAIREREDTAMLDFIERAARDPEFDVVKLEALLRMRRDMETDQNRREFNRAMAMTQAEMLPVIRDATNPHTNSTYAKLETIDAQMRPIYTRHGFSVRFGSTESPRGPEWLRVLCTVSHSGGFYELNHLDSRLDEVGTRGSTNKTGVQAVGSTVSYLRRYLLLMVFNIVLADDPDDDGETQRTRTTTTRTTERTKPPPDPLDEREGQQWLQNFRAELSRAETLAQVQRVSNHRRTIGALREQDTPADVKVHIQEAIKTAYERVSEPAKREPHQVMIDEARIMSRDFLNELPNNVAWASRLAELFPPDRETVLAAVNKRKAELEHVQTAQG